MVKVFRLDRENVLRDLERWARGLPEDVLAVILFGSLARGDHTAFSDADLLIVLSRSDKPFLDRVPDLLPRGVAVPVDVFPYTCEELAAMCAEGAGVVRVALEEGLFLRGGPQDILRVISPGDRARG